MSGNDGGPEVLIGGPERPERAPRGPRTGWARRRRVPRKAIVAVVVAGAGIAGAVYLRSGPVVPTIGVEMAPTDRALAEGTPVWLPGPDSRPTGGVTILRTVVLQTPTGTKGSVTTVGLAGPGVEAGREHTIALPAGAKTSTTVTTRVDCTKVTLPARAGDYGLQVHVHDGNRDVEGLAPVEPLASAFVSDLDAACGAWLARADLTVTQVTAYVAPIQPEVDLTLTIRNAGSGDAALGISTRFGNIGDVTLAQGEATVPAHGQAQVHLHSNLRSCDYLPDPPSNSSGNVIGTSSDYLGLVAVKGVRPPLVEDPADTGFRVGSVPTGVVMSAAAVSAVSAALRSACGDLGPYVTLIATDGSKVDAATRVLTVQVLVDGTPGRVTDLSLVSEGVTADDPSSFVPLWTNLVGLVPDSTGQVRVTLHYRLPSGTACPSDGSYLPGFSVYAHTPVPGGVRTLRFSQFINLEESPQAMAALCPT